MSSFVWKKGIRYVRRLAYILPAIVVVISAMMNPAASAAMSGYQWHEAAIASGDRIPWNSIAMDSTGAKIIAASGEVWSGGYLYTSSNYGATWTKITGLGARYWVSVASSADGTVLIAADGIGDDGASGGYMYVSPDSGATWAEQTGAGKKLWQSVALSADGRRLVAVEKHMDPDTGSDVGSVYTSTDYGVTWTEQTGAGSRAWHAVASSADGANLVAAGGHYIYTSTDYGVTWTEQTGAGSRYWTSVASSADGSKLVAATNGEYVYTSTDYGVTWTERANTDTLSWSSVASSADGSTLVAGGQNIGLDQGYFYVSTDAGASWSVYSKPSLSWVYVAANADGSVLGEANFYGSVRVSTNSGATWQERTVLGAMEWAAMASSSDGSIRAVADQGGYLYLSHDTGETWARVESLGAQPWDSIAISADGMKLFAVDGYGVFYSSSDAGATWAQQVLPDTPDLRAIASSADGLKLVMVSYGGGIYTSVDSGVTWEVRHANDNVPGHQRMAVASSADGTELITVNNGFIYMSTDSGATWVEKTDLGAQDLRSIAVSANGTIIAVASGAGSIYMSTDSGATWVEKTEAGIYDWNTIAMSSDGTKLIAAPNGGSVYISNDSGETWEEQTDLPNLDVWRVVTISSNGIVAGASASQGHVYTGISTDSPSTVTHNYASDNAPSGATSTVTTAKLRVTSAGCATITNGSTSVFAPAGLEASETGITVVGGIGYTLECASAGGSADATITLGTYVSDLTKLRVYKKSASSSVLTDITSQVTLANTTDTNHNPITTLSYTLVDGGAFDEDATANGTIVDPIYFGTTATSTGTGSSTATLAPTGENQASFLFGGVVVLGLAALLLRARKTIYN